MIHIASLLALLLGGVVLPGEACPRTSALGFQEAAQPSAEERLLEELEQHAAWCRKERALLALKEIYRFMLEVDPDHKRARGYLGYKLKGETWQPPAQDRERRDASPEVGAEARRRLAGAKANYRSFLRESLASEYLSDAELHEVEERILQLDPDDRLVHARRGESPFEGAWVMQDTLVSREQRAALHRFLQAELAAAEPGLKDEPSGLEAELKLRFHVAKTSRFRVLSTESLEESLALTRALPLVQSLFNSLLQCQVQLPYGMRLYLMGGDAERDSFLAAYPGLAEDYVTQLKRVSGTGLRGTSNWVYWYGDRAQRLDGVVRMAFAFLLHAQFKLTVRQGWLFEGLGIYLTQAVTGTRLTTFEQAELGGHDQAARGERSSLTAPDTNWMREGLAVLHQWTANEYEDIFAKPVHDMQRADLLASYVTAAYLAETHPDQLYRIAAAAPEEVSSARLVTRELGFDLEELLVRLRRWIEESHGEEFVPPIASGQLWNLWNRLTPKERSRALESFRKRIAATQTPQLELLRKLNASASEIPLQKAAAHYSASEHAPGDPIPRYQLASDSARVRAARQAFFPEPDPREEIVVYGYAWGTAQVLRLRQELSDEEQFTNAANGYAPGLDLARARALKALDGGHLRALQVAFEHAYTDREGGVYPGISLYQAWRSRKQMEMPDVDNLGIYHDLTGDWSSYVAPIDGSLHAELYGIIESFFQRILSYRELRVALAQCLLEGEPLNGQFSGPRTNLHAFWAELGADPERARAVLPGETGAAEWLALRLERDRADPKLWEAGEKRRKYLEQDANRVRSVMQKALEEALGP